MTRTVKEHLVRELAQGKFVSGQTLGEQLGISRTAIAKHIKSLIEMGLEIYSVRGKGYKLAKPLTLLNVDKVNQYLTPLIKPTILEVHSLIDSTNSYLKRRLPHQLKQGQVCLAEYQNAGRGRRGRQWVSPFGSHIYLSMYWRLAQGMSSAMGLSLVAALAVSDAINHLYQVKVQLKWPNDIYLNNVKLAGILIELEGQALEACHTIIGIGLNIQMPVKAAEQIDQQWTDLQTHVDKTIDRNKLSAEIIYCLQARLIQHQQHGLSTMIEEWHQHDVYLNKAVQLITGDRVTKGICRGINAQGALLLEVDNQVSAIYGGEVSLRGPK